MYFLVDFTLKIQGNARVRAETPEQAGEIAKIVLTGTTTDVGIEGIREDDDQQEKP